MMTPASSSRKKGLPLRGGTHAGSISAATPAATGNGNSSRTAATPATVTVTDVTPYRPPRDSLEVANGGIGAHLATSFAEDNQIWSRFREAGSLDEASLHQKDRAALISHINEVESELYEYQYNMGILLLERKELAAKHEELKRSLVELEEKMRREQAAHLIAISESQIREESLRKALGIEKQCVADLEKALHEVRSEHAEIKVSAENEVSKARQLVASIEEKSLTAESKLHAAEALQAEASRKQADTIRKLQEVQALESALQREKQFFQSEREIREAQIADDKETLRAWENRLQEGQDKLLEGRRLLKDKEESLLKKEDMLRKTEKELEDRCRRNEEQQAVLKEKEHDYNTRMASLAIREEEIVKKELYLGKKEQELIILRERLTSKESEEIQKLIDEQKTALESRKLEFESELEGKKKLVEEELGKRRYAIDVLEIEVNRKEENMKRREEQLEKKDEKIKEKEKDVDLRLKALKEKEKCNRNVEKEIENAKKVLEREREELAKSKEKLELMENSLSEQRQKVQTDTESLKVTEKERSELEKLQSNYIEEIEECRIMKKQVENEAEELKLEKEKFEKDWELLDERREGLAKEMEQVDDEKKRVSKWILEEEERLKSQEKSFHVKMQNDLDTLRLEREAFERSMEHERTQLYEQLKNEQEDLFQGTERERSELESSIAQRREELQRAFHEKESDFQKEKEREQRQIREEREFLRKELEYMKLEKHKLEKERIEIDVNRGHAEKEWTEIKKDIEELQLQREKLKEQRESLFNEREEVLRQCERLKKLQKDLNVRDDDPKQVADSLCNMPMTSSDTPIKFDLGSSGKSGPSASNVSGRLSWISKCASRLFNHSPSPGKVIDSVEQRTDQEMPNPISSEVHEGNQHVDNTSTENIMKDFSKNCNISSKDNLRNELRQDENKKVEEAGKSIRTVNFEQPQPSSSRGDFCKPNDRSKAKIFKRTRSIKAVVEDAKAILETSSDNQDTIPADNQQIEGALREMPATTKKNEESQTESFPGDKLPSYAGKKKRRRSQATIDQSVEDAEVESENTAGGRKKRKQKETANGRSSVVETPGRKRYNLRNSTIAMTNILSTEDNSGESNPQEEDPRTLKGTSSKRIDDRQETSIQECIVHEEKSGEEDRNLFSMKGEGSQILENGLNDSAANFLEVSAYEITKSETQENYAESEEYNVGNDAAEVEQEVEEIDEFEDDDNIEGNENPSIGKKIWQFLTT